MPAGPRIRPRRRRSCKVAGRFGGDGLCPVPAEGPPGCPRFLGTTLPMSIAENIARTQERIAVAARRAGRNPREIILMGVSKTFPAENVREAYEAGLRVFGENRVQE